MKTRSLFISYRSSDDAKVDRIAKDLSLLKYDDGTPRYTTWQDKHNLPPASPNWWDAIVDAIEQCEIFVFNLSHASLQSEICRAELEYARKRNRPIIPVVLDGEFFLNAETGRWDLPQATWALVPEWLKQAQFLFYVAGEFCDKFQEAVAVFERNWPRDIPAPRPLNPDSKSVHGSNHALYDAACDYARRLALTDAEKHFDVLVRRNDSDYEEAAAWWLQVIRTYAELIELDDRHSASFVFKKKWTAYSALFPREFLDEPIFDPKGFAKREQTSSAAVAPSSAASFTAPPVVQSTRLRSIDLLPAPFAWIEIPGGRGTMQTNESNVALAIPTERYWIARYPVTNAQFALFVEAGGYSTERWWTVEGWKQRQKNRWTQPPYWTYSDWNDAEQPVIKVSWYEAVAFCLWLSDVTGEKIMLPTEAQWQYAAQGDDGRAYPWGEEWDSKRCNNNVDGKGIRKPTPVRRYEGRGDSPFGVVDMAGNVWEWCSTAYESDKNDLNGTDVRMLRGGSWYDHSTFKFRCDSRIRGLPDLRNLNWGFRLALS